MSLPAWQQRVLDRMEGTLQASEPHLASMFAIFGRLNAGEPVSPEPLARPRRRRWSPSGTTLYAVVLLPVMFAMILAAVLGGSPSSAKTCGVGCSASGGSLPLLNRTSCPAAEKTASQKTASATTGGSCIAAALGADPAAWTGSALAFSRPARPASAGDHGRWRGHRRSWRGARDPDPAPVSNANPGLRGLSAPSDGREPVVVSGPTLAGEDVA